MAEMAISLEPGGDDLAQRVNAAVAAEVRSAMARKRVSGVKLANSLDTSRQALGRRLVGELAFDVVELTRIAELLDTTVAAFLDPVNNGRSSPSGLSVVPGARQPELPFPVSRPGFTILPGGAATMCE